MLRTVSYRGLEITSNCDPHRKTRSSRGFALTGRPGMREQPRLAH